VVDALGFPDFLAQSGDFFAQSGNCHLELFSGWLATRHTPIVAHTE
jgi:hypothetical protein